MTFLGPAQNLPRRCRRFREETSDRRLIRVKTLQTYTNLKSRDQGAVIALGNFDGLHRGHQAVIARAQAIADEINAPLGIGLFRPHPYRFFKPDAAPFRLMSARIGLHKLYHKYGSTEIRQALQDGDVFYAQHMLSRPWQVDGIVQQGQQRGRTINFPTANLDFADLVRPKFGVYVVEVRIDGEDLWRPGVANTGNRPTVDGEEARLEVHLLDFDRDLYGQLIDVRFRSFIRPEKKFESFEALKTQIEKDANGARAILNCRV